MKKETKIYNIGDLENDSNMHELALLIQSGHIVIFPTETVYGLGGNALDKNASKAIYEAKGRPSDNPLIIHIADKDDVYKFAKNINIDTKKLMDAFWPGPITVILEKNDIVPHETTGGLTTVAIRMPNHPVALKLIKASNLPIAAPSANLSGKPSSTAFKHVLDDFNGRVDAIIDGGNTTIGLESTVIDMTGRPTILRPGAITQSMIEKVLNQPILDLSNTKPTGEVKSPGMKYTHYKPKGNVTLINGHIDSVKAYIHTFKKGHSNNEVVIICPTEFGREFSTFKVRLLGSIKDTAMMGQNLFSALRDMDDWQAEEIFIYYKDTDELGYAMMNRILKASGYQVIDLK